MVSVGAVLASALAGCTTVAGDAPEQAEQSAAREAELKGRAEELDRREAELTRQQVDARRQAELDRRIAQLEVQIWERDAVIEDMQGRLDAAREEVVRAMAKLQTVATRAQAASAMAEADLAVQSLKGTARESTEGRQAIYLVKQSTTAFNANNFGGSLYLANQAKGMASLALRIAGGEVAGLRPKETPFASPVRLRTTARASARQGPGANFRPAFALDPGSVLTGVSHLGDWVRVLDSSGREGWLPRAQVTRRDPGR